MQKEDPAPAGPAQAPNVAPKKDAAWSDAARDGLLHLCAGIGLK
eukprot:gene6206-1503_t